MDILVATPGRLLDHLGRTQGAAGSDQFVVLDEADQMLDLGFIPAIRKLLRLVGKERQTLMFSATMVPAIRQLADDFLSNPETVAVTPPSKPVERIDQKVLYTEAADKPEALIDLMAPEAGKRTIIFTRTKHGADRVAKRLVKYGHKANAIHGDKSQNQRTRALDAFKSGESPVLVATDIAARGIDVDGVDLVVNYELPNVAENYVHRIGRTARAGATGALPGAGVAWSDGLDGTPGGLARRPARAVGRGAIGDHAGRSLYARRRPAGHAGAGGPRHESRSMRAAGTITT